MLATCGDGKEASRKVEKMPSPHPAGAAAELASGETRRAFPKERRSNREVACGRIFATGAAAGLSVEKKC